VLRGHGIEVHEHALRDHAKLSVADIDYDDELPVFMTEKDAVKLREKVKDRFWYVPVDLQMDPALALPLIEQIDSRLRAAGRNN
jgi:tetraacyldisaccharide 4'-kinase